MLRLYNYADYIDPGAIKSFEKKYAAYNVKVQVSTFNDTDEALTKIRSGKVPFDIYFPSYDQISKMVTAKLIRPLNHSYIPNIKNVWPEFTNPWYDGELAVHRPLHRLHDRHRLAYRQGPPSTRARWTTPTTPSGTTQVDPRRRHRRLAHLHGDGAPARGQGRRRSTPRDPAVLARRAERPVVDAGSHASQGHDHDVQRPARRAAVGVPDVVGRRRQRDVRTCRRA